MKLFKKSLIFAFSIMMIISILVIPAAALSGYESRFREFRQISVNDVGAHPGYTKALQQFLCIFSPYYKNIIDGAGGVDGIFGGKTGEVVGYYQSAKGIDSDGICGPDTWEKIASDLTPVDSTQSTNFTYLKFDNKRVYSVYRPDIYIYSVYIEGEGAIQFHPET